jgi:hypothetical protein
MGSIPILELSGHFRTGAARAGLNGSEMLTEFPVTSS